MNIIQKYTTCWILYVSMLKKYAFTLDKKASDHGIRRSQNCLQEPVLKSTWFYDWYVTVPRQKTTHGLRRTNFSIGVHNFEVI